MLELVVYSRRGCHLCELMLEELVPAVPGPGHDPRPRCGQPGRLAASLRAPRARSSAAADREVSVARLDRDALLAILAVLLSRPHALSPGRAPRAGRVIPYRGFLTGWHYSWISLSFWSLQPP